MLLEGCSSSGRARGRRTVGTLGEDLGLLNLAGSSRLEIFEAEGVVVSAASRSCTPAGSCNRN